MCRLGANLLRWQIAHRRVMSEIVMRLVSIGGRHRLKLSQFVKDLSVVSALCEIVLFELRYAGLDQLILAIPFNTRGTTKTLVLVLRVYRGLSVVV
jgi:hypothetical protein